MGAGESFPTLAHPQGRWAIPHDGRVRFACRINPALLPESMGVRPLPNTVARSTLRVSRRHTCGFHTKHVIKPANAVSRPYQLIERGVRAGDDRTLVGQAKFGCCILCDCSLPPCHFLLGQVSASAYPCTLRAAAWCAIGSPKPNRSGDLDEQRGILSVEEAVVCVPFVSRQEAWPSRHKRCSNRPGVSSSPWTPSDLLSPAASTASKPYPRPCVLRLDSPASHLTHCSKLVGACVGLAMAPTAGQRGFATGLRCSLPMCTGGRIRDLIAKGAAGTVGVASQWRNRLLKSSPKPPPALIEESARLLGIDEPWHFHAVPLGYVHRLIEYPVARGEELALSYDISRLAIKRILQWESLALAGPVACACLRAQWSSSLLHSCSSLQSSGKPHSAGGSCTAARTLFRWPPVPGSGSPPLQVEPRGANCPHPAWRQSNVWH